MFLQEEIYTHNMSLLWNYNLNFQLENRSLLDLTSESI